MIYSVYALFISNFAMSVLATHLVATKVKTVTRPLYWWMLAILICEGIVSLMSFMAITHPDEVFLGLPMLTWLVVSYAAVMNMLYAWVFVFHIGHKKWEPANAG